MIEKILSKIENLIMCNSEEAEACYPSAVAREYAYYECKEIVQEVAKDGGWIPCSERLPKELEHVLVCLDDCKSICVGYYYKEFGWYAQWGAFVFNQVIAWQPLPAPYQKGE